MRGIRCSQWIWAVGILAALALTPAARTARAEDPNIFPWYFSPSIGRLDFEGDEPVRDGFTGTFRLGYDWPEWWGVEAGLMIAPYLDEQLRTDWETGEKVSRLYEATGKHSTYAVGLAVDGLYHFSRWERLDPYLTVGAGLTYYGADIDNNHLDPHIRAGAGVMYHLNDEWAVRADFRSIIAGSDTEANSAIDAGVVWNWGARVPPKIVATGGPLDTDGDGLIDDDEAKWKTDPLNWDTDGDGLSDGEEVHTYRTDPLNPDTDFDGLKDGEEVHKYQTEPLKADTDAGGVSDGHEVIEDGTNPLDPKDDLILFRLYIQFDYDKADLKRQYYSDLDIIGKTIKRNPGSTVRIEGHADKLKNSKAGHNKRLSQRRAAGVLDYLADKNHIERRRMEAIGYGFDRPMAKNDPTYGNPANRRVEIYIRGADAEKALIEKGLVEQPISSSSPANP